MNENWVEIKSGFMNNNEKAQVLENILKHGYQIYYYRENGADEFCLYAYEKDKEISRFSFYENDTCLNDNNIWTHEDYRKRGIGSCLCVLAEFICNGKKIVNCWQEEQSNDAKKFWAQKNRQFGENI